MKKNNKNNNNERRINNGKNIGRRVRGKKGDSIGIIKTEIISKNLSNTEIQAESHRLEGVYIIKSNKEFIATKNLCPGEIIYGEELITIEDKKDIAPIQKDKSESEKDSNSESSSLIISNNIEVLNNQNKQSSQNKIEYRIWDIFYSKLGSAIKNGITNIYMKPGSQVLYLGAGNDSYSTISHISDLVGDKGIIYGVEKSEIKGLLLKTMSKKRENIKPIVQDARKPYIYKNYIPNLVDCIFINISEKDIATILSVNAEFFLKTKGGFVCIININQEHPNNISQTEKFDEQIKLLREYSLYVKEFISLENFYPGYAVISGIFKPYRDFLDD